MCFCTSSPASLPFLRLCLVLLIGTLVPGKPATAHEPVHQAIVANHPSNANGREANAGELAHAGTAQLFTINEILRRRGDLTAPRATPDRQQASLSAADQEPFGLVKLRAPTTALAEKWDRLKLGLEQDTARMSDCSQQDHCSAAAKRMLSLVRAARAYAGVARADYVNRTLNNEIQYVSDLTQFGEADLWSSPLVTLESRKGDCEDYAIAKYAVLRAAGTEESDLRLVIGKDRGAGAFHAVLAFRAEGIWRILDNRNASVLSDRESTHFTPLYSLDYSGVHLLAQTMPADESRSAAWRSPALSSRR